jgi:hypothetical protein
VTTVTISGVPVAPAVGQSAQLTATVTLPDGTRLNATSQATWQSSAVGIATVTSSGLLSIVAPGEADVNATLEGVRGSAHLSIAAAKRGFDISGVVRESAPTENVLLSGATVGIHFAGCPTCPQEGPEATTDDQGRFTLTGIETAGFTLWARKPGYDPTPFNIAMLPRDQRPDISIAPTFSTIREFTQGTCPSDRSPRVVTFAVHHDGLITFTSFAPPAVDGEQLSFGRLGEPALLFFMHSGQSLPIKGGFRYQVAFDCSDVYYHDYLLDFSHPN